MPGRTWEGKEELLEAVVALCASGKGSAISLEPFVWGESATASVSRGVKRGRSDPLEGEEEDETEDGGEEDGGGESSPGLTAGARRTTDSGEGTAAAATNVPRDSGDGSIEAVPAVGAADIAPAGSEDSSVDDDTNTDGTKAGFQYEDKLGDLERDSGSICASDGGSSAVDSVRQTSSTGGDPRSDEALQQDTAMLDGEDDSPVPFGDVVALMLAQLTR